MRYLYTSITLNYLINAGCGNFFFFLFRLHFSSYKLLEVTTFYDKSYYFIFLKNKNTQCHAHCHGDFFLIKVSYIYVALYKR